MSEGRQQRSYPSGRPPWDTWNGVRVGLLAGGIAGILVTVIAGITSFWLVLPGALVGGAAGYWSERRKRSPK